MFTNRTPWVVLLLLWMGGSAWWQVCQIEQQRDEALAAQRMVTIRNLTLPLVVTDGKKLNLKTTGNFSFAKASTVANEASVGGVLQTLADYLKANPGRMLEVTGYYLPNEPRPAQSANLGAARAEYINVKLIAMGVSANQLAAKGLPVDGRSASCQVQGDSLYGGLSFAFSERKAVAADSMGVASAETATADDSTVSDGKLAEASRPAEHSKAETALAEAQKFTSVLKPIDLYFDSGKPTYIETGETKKFFAEANTYLKGHKRKKLVLRGYTDSEGDRLNNVMLSRERANAVKERLVLAGIKSDRIRVMAKGESEPKASNTTEEGRRVNRRVSAVVQ